MTRTSAPARPRWLQIVAGLVVGVVAAAVAFVVVGLVRDDPVDGVTTAYRLSDEDALAPGPVSLITVRDVRQPTSIPGLATRTGDRYVSLVVAMERDDASAQQWSSLDDLSLSLYATDGSGEREELLPTDDSRRLLDGVGGRLRGADPYWIRLEYAPPSIDVADYEVDLRVDGEEYAFTARPEEPA